MYLHSHDIITLVLYYEKGGGKERKEDCMYNWKSV